MSLTIQLGCSYIAVFVTGILEVAEFNMVDVELAVGHGLGNVRIGIVKHALIVDGLPSTPWTTLDWWIEILGTHVLLVSILGIYIWLLLRRRFSLCRWSNGLYFNRRLFNLTDRLNRCIDTNESIWELKQQKCQEPNIHVALAEYVLHKCLTSMYPRYYRYGKKCQYKHKLDQPGSYRFRLRISSLLTWIKHKNNCAKSLNRLQQNLHLKDILLLFRHHSKVLRVPQDELRDEWTHESTGKD